MELNQLTATPGRASDSNTRLTNWLTIRPYCEIGIQHNQLVDRDPESVIGTLQNGRAVEELSLAAGDMFQIGLQSFPVRSIDGALHFTMLLMKHESQLAFRRE